MNYIVYNTIRKAYKTREGWTTIHNGQLMGLHDVLRYSKREAELNENTMPKGCMFVHFPQRRWKDLP